MLNRCDIRKICIFVDLYVKFEEDISTNNKEIGDKNIIACAPGAPMTYFRRHFMYILRFLLSIDAEIV